MQLCLLKLELASPVQLKTSARELRLEGAILHGLVVAVPEGSPEDLAKWIQATLDLDLVLGNVNGNFEYGFKGFSHSAKNIQLDGTVLNADLQVEEGVWNNASFELEGKVYGRRGDLSARDVPVMVGVPKVS